jgi:hypothetical protein
MSSLEEQIHAAILLQQRFHAEHAAAKVEFNASLERLLDIEGHLADLQAALEVEQDPSSAGIF